MRFPWVNTALLVLVLLQILTGFLGFILPGPSRLVFWSHSIGGFTLVILLGWKGAVILDGLRRDLGWGFRRVGFVLLTLGLVAILATGFIWTFTGPVYFQGMSLLTWHVLLALGVLGLFAWHSWYMRFILRNPASRDRRLLLRTGLAGLGGLALWRLGGWVRTGLALPGAARRVTGSYETGSFTGRFPAVIWLLDRQQPVDLETWHLDVGGTVARPLTITYQDLLRFPGVEQIATLDCTGGWYTTQIWRGVAVQDLLQEAGVAPAGRSVSIESLTGYRRRFALDYADQLLLATHVGGEPLSHGHGAPLRLVAPGLRGVSWVKWVARLQVQPTGPLWQSPLPLQ